MRKIMLVAAISFAVGGLIGAYAQQGGADAAAQSSCPPKALKQFTTALLRQGGAVPVPQECTEALLVQLYLQVYGMNARLQAHDTSLATLQGRLYNACRQMQVSC
jgi:hypothetical protein